MTPLELYSADHRQLLARAAEAARLADPVAVRLGCYSNVLLAAAKAGPVMPVEGVLVRDWCPHSEPSAGLGLGVRPYEIEGLRFAVVEFGHSDWVSHEGLAFTAVGRADYARLYRVCRQLKAGEVRAAEPPVLADDLFERLRRNTIGFLTRDNLRRVKELGGRPRRGVLLSGPPGNGKTSACRWLGAECGRRNLTFATVSAEAYAEARRSRCSENKVRDLFTPDGRGVIVFDDFDVALRDRDSAPDSDDQSVFLNALDGVRPTEGVVYVFTTNAPLERIDRAFRRPGRIDVSLVFEKPDRALRRRLISRWHADLLAGIDPEAAADSTGDFSFADLDEVKNLLILHFLATGEWDWPRALDDLAANRQELNKGGNPFGFAALNGRQ